MTTVVLGLGSNCPYNGRSPRALLDDACSRLGSVLGSLQRSSVYRSKAMYVTDQSDFYNMCVSGLWNGTAHELLDAVHVIEAALGRDRTKEIRFGPRTLDIDIELFGTECISEPELEIPHPRLKERAFVLMPLVEVLEKTADVTDRDRYKEYLRALPEQGVVKV